jgi:hypothetical protein
MSKAKKSRSPKSRLTRWVAEIVAMALARRVIRRIIDKM